jgi:transcriptional regulator with XRE-family HTH domain
MAIKTGTVLKKIIQERRLTLREIANGSGVPATTIAEWSNNRTPKNPLQVKKVAEFLGVSVHYLLFEEEDKQEPLQKILKEDFFKGTFEISIKRVNIKGGES